MAANGKRILASTYLGQSWTIADNLHLKCFWYSKQICTLNSKHNVYVKREGGGSMSSEPNGRFVLAYSQILISIDCSSQNAMSSHIISEWCLSTYTMWWDMRMKQHELLWTLRNYDFINFVFPIFHYTGVLYNIIFLQSRRQAYRKSKYKEISPKIEKEDFEDLTKTVHWWREIGCKDPLTISLSANIHSFHGHFVNEFAFFFAHMSTKSGLIDTWVWFTFSRLRSRWATIGT